MERKLCVCSSCHFHIHTRVQNSTTLTSTYTCADLDAYNTRQNRFSNRTHTTADMAPASQEWAYTHPTASTPRTACPVDFLPQAATTSCQWWPCMTLAHHTTQRYDETRRSHVCVFFRHGPIGRRTQFGWHPGVRWPREIFRWSPKPA